MPDAPTTPPDDTRHAARASSPAPSAARAGHATRNPALIAALALALAVPWALLLPAVARFQAEAALLLGIGLALAGVIAAGPREKAISKWLIQVCVVLLGFRMDLHDVWRAGSGGLTFAVGTILGTFALGWALARALRVDGGTSALLSTGTAICGGSAIAAVSGVLGSSPAQIAVATGTVFMLNGVALLLFPALGQALDLSAAQFGTWAGVAIHDVSSVVGAAQSYAIAARAPEAVDTATVVKLSRVLWIIPICLVAAGWVRARARREAHGAARGPSSDDGAIAPPPKKPSRLPVPWFIALFLLAAAARTIWPGPVGEVAPALSIAAKSGMSVALFLIGAGLSRAALASVGWRALVLGVALWASISVAALVVVRATIE